MLSTAVPSSIMPLLNLHKECKLQSSYRVPQRGVKRLTLAGEEGGGREGGLLWCDMLACMHNFSMRLTLAGDKIIR